jgi:hypothetical protein
LTAGRERGSEVCGRVAGVVLLGESVGGRVVGGRVERLAVVVVVVVGGDESVPRGLGDEAA